MGWYFLKSSLRNVILLQIHLECVVAELSEF